MTTHPAPAPSALPVGYHEVLYWRLTQTTGRVVAVQVAGLAALVVFGLLFAGLAVGVGRLPPSLAFGLGEGGWLLAGLVVTVVAHELVHGLFMRWYGARPQYGVLWQALAFYATTPGYAYRRAAFVVIALAPLVGLSAVAVLGMWLAQGTAWVAWLAICGTINAGGAVGDLWMTALVLRYPATAYVMDERDGIRVFVPAQAGQAPAIKYS